MCVKHTWHVELDGGATRAMTQENIEIIVNRLDAIGQRLNDIQTKNDADTTLEDVAR